jgi:hypothetical protein
MISLETNAEDSLRYTAPEPDKIGEKALQSSGFDA